MRPKCGFWIVINWSQIGKMAMLQLFDMTSSSIFFDVILFDLPILVTVPSFMSISSLVLELTMPISFYKRLTRNLEIGNTPVWVLPTIWRMGPVTNIKFGTNVSNKMASLIKCYWMLQSARVKTFTVSELWRENQQGLRG